MLCYHGTSADNLQSILEKGLLCETPKLWNCSLDEVYCWTKRYLEEEELEGDPDYILKQMAFESSMCALATAKDCRPIIVLFEVEDWEVVEDYSCPNMLSDCVQRDIKPEEIREILVGPDLSLLRGYFINIMMGRELSGIEFTEVEKKVGRLFYKVDFDMDDFCSVEDFKNLNMRATSPLSPD